MINEPRTRDFGSNLLKIVVIRKNARMVFQEKPTMLGRERSSSSHYTARWRSFDPACRAEGLRL
jgi:hypothetical protein